MHLSGIRMLTIFVWVIAAIASRSAEAKTIYVNASAGGAGDGTSWSKAYNNLQAALDDAAATPGYNEIWVAKGTYTPTRIYSPSGIPGGAYGTAADQLKTFNLPDQVAIYGGFAGSEKSRAGRSPVANLTVLSGVLGAGQNSWHVVTAGNDIAQTGVRATLDGLTITGGSAVGPAGNNLLFYPFNYGHNLGGGLYVAFDSVIQVDNVDFRNNHAGVLADFSGDGGGLFSINSTLTVTGSRFTGNTAVLRGGALEVLNTYEGKTHHDARIVGSSFTNNFVGIFGGAIVGEGTVPNAQSSLLIDDCAFEYNRSEFEGGAIVFDSLNTTVRNSRFNSNSAKVAAGALATTNIVDTFVYASQNPPVYSFQKFATTVVGCTFNGNTAEGDAFTHSLISGAFGVNFARGGGALVTYMNGYMNVTNSTFSGNTAWSGDGGAMLNGASDAHHPFGTSVDVYDVETTVVGSWFSGNSAVDGNGGAIASLPGSSDFGTVASTRLSVVSSGFTGNSASAQGGGIYLNDSTAKILGKEYSANTPNQVYGVSSIINGSSTTPYIIW